MMMSNMPAISAFLNNTKSRNPFNEAYLVKRLRHLFNSSVSNYENTFGEKPNTIYTSMFILNKIAANKAQIVKIVDDKTQQFYFQSLRVIPTRVNIIVAAVCNTEAVLAANLREINKQKYDLVSELDLEFDTEYFIREPLTVGAPQ